MDPNHPLYIPFVTDEIVRKWQGGTFSAILGGQTLLLMKEEGHDDIGEASYSTSSNSEDLYEETDGLATDSEMHGNNSDSDFSDFNGRDGAENEDTDQGGRIRRRGSPPPRDVGSFLASFEVRIMQCDAQLDDNDFQVGGPKMNDYLSHFLREGFVGLTTGDSTADVARDADITERKMKNAVYQEVRRQLRAARSLSRRKREKQHASRIAANLTMDNAGGTQYDADNETLKQSWIKKTLRRRKGNSKMKGRKANQLRSLRHKTN